MSVEKVKDYFKKYNIEDRIIELANEIATVADAAKYLECDEDMIAKTLSFNVDGKTILIVASGNTRIDNAKYKQEFGTKARMLSYEEVEQRVGHKVGGVCPFAVNDDVEVYLDKSLKKHKHIYPACGSTNSAIKLSLEELEKYSNYKKWVDIGK